MTRGALLAGTLADRLGVEDLVNQSVWLGYGTPGCGVAGCKVLSLIDRVLAGADSIDAMIVLRAGSTQLHSHP